MTMLKASSHLSHPTSLSSVSSNRKRTEEWLEELIEKKKFNFRYFITLSFNRAQTSVISQYLDNKHIKKVILDFFYPNRKPTDRLRIWFFVERHQTGFLHLHMLMEDVDTNTWLMTNNRKITLRKKSLASIVDGDFFMEDIITEALTNHLQNYIRRLGRGKQGVDIRDTGNVHQRVSYLNKSLNTLDFNQWEHIDFQNSDL